MRHVHAVGVFDMGEEPKYLMRFVGFKEDGSGNLKRAAPSGYSMHQLLELPFSYSLEPFWEMVDNIPDLILPDVTSEDSVFEAEARDSQLKYVMPVEGDPKEVYVIHYDSMTVKTLKLFIEQRGGTVDRKWRKADLVVEARRLEEALRAAPRDKSLPENVVEEPEEEPEEELDLTNPLEIPEPETGTRAYPEPEEPPDELSDKITEDDTETPE